MWGGNALYYYYSSLLSSKYLAASLTGLPRKGSQDPAVFDGFRGLLRITIGVLLQSSRVVLVGGWLNRETSGRNVVVS